MVRFATIASADDFVLTAFGANGLLQNINRMREVLPMCGSVVNISKSFIFSWVGDRKRKRVVYDTSVDGCPIYSAESWQGICIPRCKVFPLWYF